VDFTLADPIVRTLLYEGDRPYEFGSLVPMSYSLAHAETEPWSMQTECLVRGNERTRMQGRVRFLHPDGMNPADVREREWAVPECTLFELAIRPAHVEFLPRESSGLLQAVARLSVERATTTIFKMCVRIENRTPVEHADRSRIAAYRMVSTHALLGVSDGRFLSLIDPPDDARELAESCRNRGVWPILIGNSVAQDMLLAAPIILCDYPQVAPESPTAPADFEPGDRVRLRPQGRADILDVALAGQRATVSSVEQDFEGRILVAVTIDGDPGQDLGAAGKPGHRFFFRPEEVERVSAEVGPEEHR
jgi:hypothetical protein